MMSRRGSSNNILFSPHSLLDHLALNTSLSDKEKIEAEQTLLAIKEFTRYLQRVEKELSSMSKRLRKKEIAQSVGFVGSGIHEAIQYLSIVKKVIGKTQRILDKKALSSSQETTEPTPKSAED
jgi:ABC-type uncharacterized transport system ATPase subunit